MCLQSNNRLHYQILSEEAAAAVVAVEVEAEEEVAEASSDEVGKGAGCGFRRRGKRRCGFQRRRTPAIREGVRRRGDDGGVRCARVTKGVGRWQGGSGLGSRVRRRSGKARE